ncbi:hypothetical protein BpHYR1_033172 [Brachionus plicatilis]|uniref:Uncharacterized protein n=1 Tax=Brachionus plicatilis TaxID=10195 RepID=A0A3M7QLK2_BRAPC|nr:hypothetical protein BpHYR1_033172 [Brachionus plicatilis]
MSLVTRRDYFTYLSLVINIDRLRFKLYPPKQAVRWYTDASEYQLGAVHDRSGEDETVRFQNICILIRNPAELCALQRAHHRNDAILSGQYFAEFDRFYL